jgi:beta-carotene 15,15'-dioxygenase
MHKPGLAIAVVLGCACLLALRALEAYWPMMGWWAFVLLSLTLGFGHGALDAVLLVAQFQPLRKAALVSTAYLLSVVLAAVVLAQFTGIALLALLLMSLWHFGEGHGQTIWHRISVGGASVMWPALLASDALSQLLAPLLGDSMAWVLWTWRTLAWCWIARLVWTFLPWRKRTDISAPGAGWVEVIAVGALYVALSPLLAFALYFGLYHCLDHIRRVHRGVQRQTVSARYGVALLLVSISTAMLLAMLWVYQTQPHWSPLTHSAQVLNWIVVALTAVTLPHLVLIGFSAPWLRPNNERQSSER